MYYINSQPNESGNYGNPQSQPVSGALQLPGELLSDYIAARGFVLPTVEDGTVTALETNRAALDAYLAEYPDPDPDQEPEPGGEGSVWDEMAAAIREGVDDVE